MSKPHRKAAKAVQAMRHQPAFDEQADPFALLSGVDETPCFGPATALNACADNNLALSTKSTDALPPEWWIEVNQPIDADEYQRGEIESANSGTEPLNQRN